MCRYQFELTYPWRLAMYFRKSDVVLTMMTMMISAVRFNSSLDSKHMIIIVLEFKWWQTFLSPAGHPASQDGGRGREAPSPGGGSGAAPGARGPTRAVSGQSPVPSVMDSKSLYRLISTCISHIHSTLQHAL